MLCVVLFCLPPLGSLCALSCFVSAAWPFAAPWWFLPPSPSPFVSRGFCRCRSVPWFFFFPLAVCAPVVFGFLWFPAPGALGLGAVFSLFCGPPAARLCVRSRLVCVSRFSSMPLRAPSFFCFFFSCVVRPRCLWLSLVSGPGCPGPWRCAVFALLASCFSALRALLPLSCFPPGRLLPSGGCCPPPPFVSRGFRRCRSVLCAVCCGVLCVPGCGAAPRCCALCRPVLCCCVLYCFVALVVCRCLLCRALWRCPFALKPCALQRCVLRCSPVLCALCSVCFLVAWWCALLFAALLCAVCVLGCCAERSLSSPLCAVLCLTVLARLRCAVPVVRAVTSAWCCGALLCVVLFPFVCCGAVLGLVARGCLLVASFCVGVPVWPRGLLPCGWCGLLWCPASLCRVLWCCAVAWCCAAVLCCPVAMLLVLALPSCGLSCCAVLCCWLAVLFFARWWCLHAMVPFPRAGCSLSSPLCALMCLAVLAVVPCFPVSCPVALCCRVVLCCCALLSFCAAVCACFALLWPVVRRRAVLGCAVGCLCCFLPDGGVCVWWCPFPPCRHAQKTSVITLCYPASVSVSVVHIVEESGFFVRRCRLVCRRLS